MKQIFSLNDDILSHFIIVKIELFFKLIYFFYY